MLLSPEQQSQVAQIRAKHLAGTAEAKDYHEYILILRAGRVASQVTSTKSRAKKAPVDVKALFDDIDKI